MNDELGKNSIHPSSFQFPGLPAYSGLKTGLATAASIARPAKLCGPKVAAPPAQTCSHSIGPLVGGRLAPLSAVGVRESGKVGIVACASATVVVQSGQVAMSTDNTLDGSLPKLR